MNKILPIKKTAVQTVHSILIKTGAIIFIVLSITSLQFLVLCFVGVLSQIDFTNLELDNHNLQVMDFYFEGFWICLPVIILYVIMYAIAYAVDCFNGD